MTAQENPDAVNCRPVSNSSQAFPDCCPKLMCDEWIPGSATFSRKFTRFLSASRMVHRGDPVVNTMTISFYTGYSHLVVFFKGR